MGEYTFVGCTILTSVTIPGIVTKCSLKNSEKEVKELQGLDDNFFKALVRSSGNLARIQSSPALPSAIVPEILGYLSPKDVLDCTSEIPGNKRKSKPNK